MEPLLTRDEFRNTVFERDKYLCVICGNPSVDSHHILERRLFDDFGYYISNGASLCSRHHILAEQTVLSCEEIREKAGIINVILPEHLYNDNEYKYTKWGDIILPNGKRIKGELFFDESVQKILKEGDVLNDYLDYVKHPRTYHLNFSEKISSDDKALKNSDQFLNREVVLSLKYDGEQFSLYSDYIHARSINSNNHPSRNWVKGLWSRICYEIPKGWRICGENLYAKHTISYKNLESYFYVHSIWNEKNECLSWDDTKDWCELLSLNIVPEIYCGTFDETTIKKLCFNTKEIDGNIVEGFVLRNSKSFSYGTFRKNVAKFVHKNFEIKHGHWMRDVTVKNELKSI